MKITGGAVAHGQTTGQTGGDHHQDLPALITGAQQILIGASSGVLTNASAMSQAEAEAGVGTGVQGVASQRIKQAIAAQAVTEPATLAQILTVNANIQFPATQVANAGANVLDDYEEGDWTPDLSFAGGQVGMTHQNQQGTYTKVGRLVTYQGSLTLSAKGTSTGNMRLSGFPLTLGSGGKFEATATLRLGVLTFADYPMASMLNNGITMDFREITNAGVVTNLTDANCSDTTFLQVSGHYYT